MDKKLLEDIQNKNLKYDDLKNFSNTKSLENLSIKSFQEPEEDEEIPKDSEENG